MEMMGKSSLLLVVGATMVNRKRSRVNSNASHESKESNDPNFKRDVLCIWDSETLEPRSTIRMKDNEPILAAKINSHRILVC